MMQILELLGKTYNFYKSSLTCGWMRCLSTLLMLRRSILVSLADSDFMFQQSFSQKLQNDSNGPIVQWVFEPVKTLKRFQMHIKTLQTYIIMGDVRTGKVLNERTFGFKRGFSKDILLMVRKAFRRLQGKGMCKGKVIGARGAMPERYSTAR